MAFDEGRNLAVAAFTQKVTFPMTWHRPIFSRGRTLADRYRANDPAVIVSLLRVVARTAHDSRAPQMFQQLLFQGASGLNEEAAINGFVWYLECLVARVRTLQPSGDLLR